MDATTLAAELTSALCFITAGWVVGWLPAAIRHARERELHRRTRARLLRWRAHAKAAHAEVSRLVACELDEALALDAVIRAGESECGNYSGGRHG